MRYLLRFVCVCALGVVPLMGCGCTRACTLVGCWAGLIVELEPEISSTYDVELSIDGATSSFTCAMDQEVWQVADVTGAVPFFEPWCTGAGFSLLDGYQSPPRAVRVTVVAQDGNWTGSNSEEPEFKKDQPNGPGCPPVCRAATLTIQAQ